MSEGGGDNGVTLPMMGICGDPNNFDTDGTVPCGPDPEAGKVQPNGQPTPAATSNTVGNIVPKTSPEASGSDNSSPKIEVQEEEKSWWESAVSAVASMDTHEVLDTVGLIPGLGIAADLSNAALYAYEGDYVNAGISMAAASPIGGQAATAAKYAKKAAGEMLETAASRGAKEVAEAGAEKAASKAAKDAPTPSGGGKGGPPDKPPKKTDEPEPEEPKKPKEGDGKDGGYVEGKRKLEDGAEFGVLDDSVFAQVPAKPKKAFSPEGQSKYSELAGRDITTVDDLTDALKKGEIKPSQVPIDYVTIDGKKVIANTRTSTALTNAGIPKNQWYGIDKTGVKAYGDVKFDDLVQKQLDKNYQGSISNARR